MIKFKKSEDKLKQRFNKGMWAKTDEISVYPTKRFFSKNTSNKIIHISFVINRFEIFQV